MGEIGIDAQVAIQDPGLKLRTAWSYGEDFNTFARWERRVRQQSCEPGCAKARQAHFV
jgi:hypothetical protein